MEKERQKRKFRPSSFFFVCLALIKKGSSSKIAFLPSPTNVWFFMGTYIHFTIFQKLFWLGWKNKGVGGAPAALHSMPKKQRFLSFIWCYASIHFSHVLNYYAMCSLKLSRLVRLISVFLSSTSFNPFVAAPRLLFYSEYKQRFVSEIGCASIV